MADTATSRGIEIRPLDTVEEVFRASDVLAEVWGGDTGGMPPNLLRALAHSGNYAVGLYEGGAMVGASVAFFAAPASRSMHMGWRLVRRSFRMRRRARRSPASGSMPARWRAGRAVTSARSLRR